MAEAEPTVAPAVQWQQAATSRDSRDDVGERHDYYTSDFTQPTHILLQHINVFHSPPKPLGRLGEPALHSHHLQGAAVHRRLHPAVRSSGPHWPVWHEYVARDTFTPTYHDTNKTADNSLKNLPLFAVPASLTFG
jgi:hypothetical protein